MATLTLLSNIRNILYDFIKIKGKEIKRANILNNTLLPFVTKNVSDDGEVFKSHKTDENGKPIYRKPYRKAEYNSLSFSYSNLENPQTFYLAGSLHKYFNRGIHNHNDFKKEDIDYVLRDLKDKFEIDLKACKVENLEIGVNIILPNGLNAREIINGCLFHARKKFITKKDDQWGQYIQCEHSQYIVKIYDKGLQYRKLGHDITDEVLRYEIKFIKNEIINAKTGINTLGDLLTCKQSKLQEVMLENWERILFFDPTLKMEDDRIYKYSTQKFWEDLGNRKMQNDPTKKSNSSYYKHLKKYGKLVDKFSEKIHSKVSYLIQQKIEALFDRGTTFDHLPIMSNLTPPTQNNTRICPVTRLNIDMQKRDSFLLSNTGLKFYEKNDPKKFEYIKLTLLTGNHNEYEKNIYSRISKQIRNRFFNNPMKYTEQPTLFEIIS